MVCVGELFVDCFAQEPGNSLASIKRWTSLPGGAAATIACALVKLGTSTEFVGAVGDDRWGAALIRLLHDLQVGYRGVQIHPTAPTREVFISRSQAGQSRFLGFTSPETDGYADAYLQASTLDATLFMASKYLVMGTTGLAYPDTRQAMEHCIQWALQRRQRILVNVNWQSMFWSQPAIATSLIYDLLRQAAFVRLALKEAEWLFDTQDPASIAAQLPNLEGVLITAGASGCAYWLAGNSGVAPSFKVDVDDTIGAGEAFVAGFLHQLYHQGKSCLYDAQCAHDLVTYAHAVAALTTTRPGAIAAQPSGEEVDAFLFLRQ